LRLACPERVQRGPARADRGRQRSHLPAAAAGQAAVWGGTVTPKRGPGPPAGRRAVSAGLPALHPARAAVTRGERPPGPVNRARGTGGYRRSRPSRPHREAWAPPAGTWKPCSALPAAAVNAAAGLAGVNRTALTRSGHVRRKPARSNLGRPVEAGGWRGWAAGLVTRPGFSPADRRRHRSVQGRRPVRVLPLPRRRKRPPHQPWPRLGPTQASPRRSVQACRRSRWMPRLATSRRRPAGHGASRGWTPRLARPGTRRSTQSPVVQRSHLERDRVREGDDRAEFHQTTGGSADPVHPDLAPRHLKPSDSTTRRARALKSATAGRSISTGISTTRPPSSG